MNKLCTSLYFFALVLTGFGLLDSIEYEYLDQIERVAFYDQFRDESRTKDVSSYPKMKAALLQVNSLDCPHCT